MKPNSTEIFASCSVDSNVIIWNVANKKEPLVHKLSDHVSYVTSVEWIPDTDKLVSASFDHTIKIWDTGQGKLLHTLEKHKDPVTRISLSQVQLTNQSSVSLIIDQSEFSITKY